MSSITKVCCQCKQEKPLDGFHRHKSRKDGHHAKCKACLKTKQQEYYQQNKEKILAQQQTPEGRARHHKHSINYYHRNQEECNQRSLEHWRNNKERHKERLQNWRKRNPDKTRAQKQNRRARVKGGGGSFTPQEWRNLCSKFDNRCVCCGANNVVLAVDHIVPVSQGGTSNISNIQPLCKSCNSSKGTRIIDYRKDAYKRFEQLSFW